MSRKNARLAGLKLFFRLLNGAAKGDIVRAASICAAFLLTSVVLFLSFSIPQIQSEQHAREDNRTPVYANPGENPSGHMLLDVRTDLFDDQLVTQYLITNHLSEKIPGVLNAPHTGEIVLSPALRTLYFTNPDVRRTLPGDVIGDISPEGLVDPNELFAYVGVGENKGEAVLSFGTYTPASSSENGVLDAFLIFAILIGIPAFIPLLIASRLSIRTRIDRLKTLRLLGLSKNQAAQIFAIELLILAGFGLGFGYLVNHFLNPFLGKSGLLGFYWFPQDGRVDIPTVATSALIVGVFSYTFGYISARRALHKPEKPNHNPKKPLLKAAGKFLFAGVYCAALGSLLYSYFLAPRQLHSRNTTGMWICFASVSLLIIAGMAIAPKLVTLIGKFGAKTRLKIPAPFRLGLQLIREHKEGSVLSIISVGLLISIMVLSGAFMQTLVFSARGPANTAQTYIDFESLSPEDREEVFHLTDNPETPGYINYNGVSESGSVVSFVVGSYQDYWDVNYAPFGLVIDCADCSYGRSTTSLEGESEISAGETIRVPGIANEFAQKDYSFTAPQETIHSPNSHSNIFITPEQAPWIWEAPDILMGFRVSTAGSSYADFVHKLLQISPHIVYNTHVQDPNNFENYRLTAEMLSFASTVGLLISLLAVLLAGISQSLDQRHSNQFLHLAGIRRRSIFFAGITQRAIPLAVTLLYFWSISYLGGASWLYLSGAAV